MPEGLFTTKILSSSKITLSNNNLIKLLPGLPRVAFASLVSLQNGGTLNRTELHAYLPIKKSVSTTPKKMFRQNQRAVVL